MILSNVAIKNRTTVGLLVLLIVVAGLSSYMTLPREAAPDVPIPIVLVTTTYEGVSPEDVESSVTMKIEQKLAGLKGLKELRSTSREGMSQIVLEFYPDVVIDDALQYVRDKVDQAKPDLPDDAEEPKLSEINIAEFPIMMIGVSGPISPVRLKQIAEGLEDRIEQVSGVLECDVLGALEREIRIEFDADRLAAYRISIPELIGLIPGENVNISAGGLETPGTKFNVRVPAEFTEPGDIDHLLLTVRDGKPIYLSDIAAVVDTFKDRESISRLDGQSSITLLVKKRVGTNLVEIAGYVQAILTEARKQVPKGVQLDVTLDGSKDVRMMVADLENNILTAFVLVVVVLMVAMGLRTSLIVSLAIPLSMLASLALLEAMGITLNMVVLFSLVLSLGMLIDNGIVIVENIYRFMQLGYGRIEAAMKGTAEVAWPVITSTATTVAAFAPLLLWEGIMGEFMKYMPITVIVVLTCSLFVALIISPVVATVIASAKGRTKSAEHRNRPQRVYRWFLDKALCSGSSRAVTLILAVLCLAGVGVLYGKYQHGLRFFPDIDPTRAIVNIRSPQGTSIQYSDLLAKIAESRIRNNEAKRHDLEHITANVGSAGGGQGFSDSPSGPHIGTITLVFHDYADRRRPSGDAVAEIRELLADIPGAEVRVGEEQHGPPTGAAITVRIAGDDFKELADFSERAKSIIAGVPGAVNLRSDYEGARPELQFVPDRQRAMLLNVNTNLIGQFLKTAVFGMKVSIYRQFNDEYDITVRLPVTQRESIDELFRLQVPNSHGDPVPLSSLGRFEYRGGLGQINRIDEKRVITLSADVEGRLPEAALKDVQNLLAGVQPPQGVTITYAGEKEEQDKATAFLGRTYVIAILAILMIMVVQFNSLGVPIIIMATVLLSLTGVGFGLLVTGTPFVVIMTGIGIVSLAGVVVNNAIVLLAYTRQLQKRGMSLIEAMAEAGMTRLRPVFLTAVTTILGLVPMATGMAFDFHTLRFNLNSESSLWWGAMARAVIFGLGFATVLTLIVVPTMYMSLYSVLNRLMGRKELTANSST
ncbi:MAG: efflux RND transporter permease subunit [Planctomycetes bacterium]|nr:efflux RND transporter permease subunit [Planctomycetota bacterium]